MANPPKANVQISLPSLVKLMHMCMFAQGLQTFLRFDSHQTLSLWANYELVNHITLWGWALTSECGETQFSPVLEQKLSEIPSWCTCLVGSLQALLQKQKLPWWITSAFGVSLYNTRNIPFQHMSLIRCSKNPLYSPYLKNLKDKPSIGSANWPEDLDLRSAWTT